MITKNHLSSILVALVFGVNAGGAIAQSYPTKPIRFIVRFPAGGSTDVGARVIAEYLSRNHWGGGRGQERAGRLHNSRYD